MPNDLISFVLHYSKSVYIDDKVFLKTIQSIFNQTYKNLEVIVITQEMEGDLKSHINESNTESLPVHGTWARPLALVPQSS